MKRRWTLAVTMMAFVSLTQAQSATPYDFSAADRAIEAAIEKKQCPGAVLLVGKGDEIVYHKAFGQRAVLPAPVPMTLDTIFDMASLSKPIGCATSVLLLADRGKIELNATVATYLPAFGNNGKESITVEDLLLHRGGLIPDNPMSDYVGTRDEMIHRIMTLTPKWKPRTHFAYTDVGFEVLGELVHAVDGRPLDQFAREELFVPLGMIDTGYQPEASLRSRIAPTEKREGDWIVGVVHDPRAYALGGVAGHAGLFSTAADTSRWVRMINAGGVLDGKRVLSEAIVKKMLTLQTLPDGSGGRGLGVDMTSSFSSPRGSRFPKGTSFGHTGWTGTSFWSDPESDVYVILLTSRVHPDGKGDVKALRTQVATACAEAILGPSPSTQAAD